MYGLHSLQGQFTNFHFLISLLKAFTVSKDVAAGKILKKNRSRSLP